MKKSTKLRLLGGAVLMFNLWLVGHYDLSTFPVLLLTFGFAIGFEYLVVRPSSKETATLKQQDNLLKRGVPSKDREMVASVLSQSQRELVEEVTFDMQYCPHCGEAHITAEKCPGCDFRYKSLSDAHNSKKEEKSTPAQNAPDSDAGQKAPVEPVRKATPTRKTPVKGTSVPEAFPFPLELERKVYDYLLSSQKKDEATMLQALVTADCNKEKADILYYKLRYQQILESGEIVRFKREILLEKDDMDRPPGLSEQGGSEVPSTNLGRKEVSRSLLNTSATERDELINAEVKAITARAMKALEQEKKRRPQRK